MKKRKLAKPEKNMHLSKQIASSVIVLAIVFGLIGYYKIGLTTTQASQPPEGGGAQEIYVNNVKGNDASGNGSLAKPFASPAKAFKVANASFAGSVKIWITATSQPYKLATDLGFKRNNLEVAGYSGRPMLIGASEGYRLYEFTVDDTWANKIVGMDTRNYRIRVNQGHQLVIDQMSFLIDDMTRLDKPIVWLSGDHAGTSPGEYVNNEVTITRNTFLLAIPSGVKLPTLVPIQVESIRDSVIALNTFKSGVWNVGIKITDALAVKSGANQFVASNLPNPAPPLYLFDEVHLSPVYSVWKM